MGLTQEEHITLWVSSQQARRLNMILRIIDKETGLFKRDDFVYDFESEQGIETPCPEGFSYPKWDGEQWVENGGIFEPQKYIDETANINNT